jgi:tetratricopeptide (TPR) repeat protein
MTGSLRAPQAALFVAVLTCIAFLNSFFGLFVYDDIHEIERNPAMVHLFPPWDAMFHGNMLPARPLPYLTFAIDHAIWGKRPFGYHFLNVAIHLAAALALFELVRLTLVSPRLGNRFVKQAVVLAMVSALLWAVHPLQTQAVTYIYQRIESMTGMFCLVSLACFARAAASGANGKAWDVRWLAGSVAACAAAMASKENAVVIPILILAYDWFFTVPTLGDDSARHWCTDVWKRRGFYAALASTWTLLGLQLLWQGGRYQEFEDIKHSPLDYLLTQSGVILHYIRLALYPIGQQFDYCTWPVAKSLADVWPAFLIVVILVAATAIGTAYRRPWAALGVLFFVSLAPTSSIIPIEAVANEHRMYTPLAAVAVTLTMLVVITGDQIRRFRRLSTGHGSRLVALVTAGVLLALIAATQFRNQLYSRPSGIWLDLIDKDRENYRAYWMLAGAVDAEGDTDFAMSLAEEAVRRRPDCRVLSDIAYARMNNGDMDIAESALRLSLSLVEQLLPSTSHRRHNVTLELANFLHRRRQPEEVRSLCESVLSVRDAGSQLVPADEVTALYLLADAWENAGDGEKSQQLSSEAVTLAQQKLPPADTTRLNALIIRANVLGQHGNRIEAVRLLREGIQSLRRIPHRSPFQEQQLKTLITTLQSME